jgi:hypothetical protein
MDRAFGDGDFPLLGISDREVTFHSAWEMVVFPEGNAVVCMYFEVSILLVLCVAIGWCSGFGLLTFWVANL